MSRLLHDRYLMFDDTRGCDLVTGHEVTKSQIPDPKAQEDGESQFREVLAHGCEGEPRWIVADARNGAQAAAIARRAAADGRRCGFVPIAADLYLRFGEMLTGDLAERALLLVGGFGVTVAAARAALLQAAAAAPRPHLLLTFRSTATRCGACVVREARPVYGAAALEPVPFATPPDAAIYVAQVERAGALAGAGRHAAAERLLRESAAALLRRRHLALAVSAEMALGRLLLERGRATDADRTFDEAARHAHAAQDERTLLAARVWQCAARADAGRLTEAEAVCRAALIAGTLAPSVAVLARAELSRVLLAQQRRDVASAGDLSLSAAARVELGAVTAAFVDGVAVTVSLASGRVFDAGQRARAAADAADGDGDPLARAIAHTAHLRVLAETGDLTAAAAAFAIVRGSARAAHAPLRLARARLTWHDALRRAGRAAEADRHLACLTRVSGVAPAALRAAIQRRARGDAAPFTPSPAMGLPPEPLAPLLIRLVHEEERDEGAIQRVVDLIAAELVASRVDLLSCDAGPVSTLQTTGSGRGTHLGARVLDAGIVIGPELADGGYEVAVPVRLGPQLLAGLVARWPIDREPPAHATAVLQLAAAAMAARVEQRLAGARIEVAAATTVPELVGVSTAIADVRRSIVRAAHAPFNVLIEGESGVGKELVARAVHQLGPRRERRFCDVNCAAIPEELLDAELFGHARGAFTGAVTDRPGLFEDADGGTLFLDEIADLSSRGQAKLLRVLQQQEVRRVGESFTRKVDVRLVAAANRDMRVEAAEGRFRQDLLYRLDVIRIHVPPLRERPADVALLAEHYWRAATSRVASSARLTHGVLASLTHYHWPGNVRELQNVMAALAVAAPSRGRVQPSLLPAAIAGAASVGALRLSDARAEFERRCIEVALARAAGNRSRAAAQLGLSRQGLAKTMGRLGM